MPSTPQEIGLTFEKGLVTEVEDSVLDQGQASALVNWEPSPNGSLRVRNAYTSISTSGLSSPYQTRGFGSIASGGSAGGTSGVSILQTGRWPDGANADPLATKTITLTGCTIGNVLVAVVSENSGETPTVTAGWTQRAVSTAERQYVKFYTKTAASSTEAFTYTITQFRIRSVTVYELARAAGEDPGSEWSASTILSGSGGTASDTLTESDTDGGIVIGGTYYDAGTPFSAASGTAGVTALTTDNSNSRTGVTIEELDLLSSGAIDMPGTTYVTPSWTPPDDGVLFCVIMRKDSSVMTGGSITGCGLTWTNRANNVDGVTTLTGWAVYTADLSQPGKSTGSLTVAPNSQDANGPVMITFFRAIGADTTTPVVQSQDRFDSTFSQNGEAPTALTNPLAANSVVVGFSFAYQQRVDGQVTLGAASGWTSTIDQRATLGAVFAFSGAVMHQDADAAVQAGANTAVSGSVSADGFLALIEIGGTGAASKDAHATFSVNGTVTSEYTYVANRRMTQKIVSWGSAPADTGSAEVTFYITLAVADGTNGYKIYRILRDDITTGTWEQIDAVTDATGNSSWVSFAQGAGKLIWTATSLSAPRSIDLTSLLATNVTDLAGKVGRVAVYHKDRMFIAGNPSTPSRVYFSGIGDPQDFVTVTDFLDIGGDDGEAVQDLVSVEGLLLVAKTNRSYLISGSGIESFFVNELPGGTAAAGKPASRTPYGTILAGVDDVWNVQGGGVDPMSRPLGGEYVAGGNLSTAYAQDMCLIADSSDGTVWRLNLVTGAWSKEDTRTGDGQIYNMFSLNGRIYYGTNGSTTQVGGTRKLSDVRTYDQTTGGMDFEASTGRLSLVGPGSAYTPRYIYLQLRSHDTSVLGVLTATVETDLGTRNFTFDVTESTQRFTRALGFTKGATWIKITFSASSSATRAAIDVERAVLAVDAEAR